MGLPRWLSGKEFACQCRNHKERELNPWVRKILSRRKCDRLHYSCLGNPTERGTWQATVHGVAKESNTT